MSDMSNLHNGGEAIGFWIYDGQERRFMLDRNCAEIFSITEVNQWVPENRVLSCLTVENIERYFRVMESTDTGGIVFEDVMITRGANAHNKYVINGSVLSRFHDGKVCRATGYIACARSSFSDFIAREIAGDDFFSWDGKTGILRFSSSYCRLLGYKESEFPQNWVEWNDIVHTDDRDIMDIEHHIINSASYGDSFEFCLRLKHKSGSYVWTIGRGLVVHRDANGRATSMIGTFSDVNLVQDNFENIKQMLYTDTLTGLKNRSFFQHNLSRWQDESQHPISVIYGDVTGLKIINDVLGHADGDILLLTVAEALNTIITRPSDIMRLAGDEFLAILPNCDASECEELCEKLKQFMDEHNKNFGMMPTFVGYGCSTMGEVDNDTLHACIERADVRMQAYKDAMRKENYSKLKVYLEMRKGRPVSMRDGRRLEYYSKEQRAEMQELKKRREAMDTTDEAATQAVLAAANAADTPIPTSVDNA
ncbi:sensor domain-containing diguanylate cyclase [Anaerobiospirillum succiniciproducens]|uniref:sensor domain-containing diguanylate cyclase n=1 Tax=Anaerobiospirillum succiniciproducens TaxID=13335 RepID=UPI00235637CA|nr:diguanylate cyclase [Anaerobiospirillum succiniciproducens]MCI6862966.1 sensor domain-containing diguanylate cyclase [Anaerobiospirillum succiniciproducens]